MKINADELFSAGITRIGYHGFPYEYMDRPDPGWFPFSSQYELIYTFSSHLNFHNPFWPFLKPLNDYMARVGTLLQAGHSVSRVALYSHRLYYPSWMPVDEDYPLEYSLMANGYNFDFINEDTLLHHASVENHELHTPGNVYPSLVLRDETRITLQLAEKLRDFARAGLPIVFAEQMPSEEVSFKDYRDNGKQIQQIMREIVGSDQGLKSKPAIGQGRGSVRFIQDATTVPELLQSELKVELGEFLFLSQSRLTVSESSRDIGCWQPHSADLEPLDRRSSRSPSVSLREGKRYAGYPSQSLWFRGDRSGGCARREACRAHQLSGSRADLGGTLWRDLRSGNLRHRI
jgi:hypothetical protein